MELKNINRNESQSNGETINRLNNKDTTIYYYLKPISDSILIKIYQFQISLTIKKIFRY